jgi:hypothetical protein
MKDFSFQGKIYLALRNPSTGAIGAHRWVDDAGEFQVKFTQEVESRKESNSGQRLTSVRLGKGTTANVSMKLNAFSVANLGLGFGANPVNITTGSATAEPFPSALVVGDTVMLDHRDVSALAITDSTAGTPKTLVLGTDYLLEHPETGFVTIKNIGTYVQPFKAAYTYAAAVRLPLFTKLMPERAIAFDGINTVDGGRVRGLLYRASFEPFSQLDLISDSLGSLELTGELLYDPFAADSDTLGNFGYFDLAAEATP